MLAWSVLGFQHSTLTKDILSSGPFTICSCYALRFICCDLPWCVVIHNRRPCLNFAQGGLKIFYAVSAVENCTGSSASSLDHRHRPFPALDKPRKRLRIVGLEDKDVTKEKRVENERVEKDRVEEGQESKEKVRKRLHIKV